MFRPQGRERDARQYTRLTEVESWSEEVVLMTVEEANDEDCAA